MSLSSGSPTQCGHAADRSQKLAARQLQPWATKRTAFGDSGICHITSVPFVKSTVACDGADVPTKWFLLSVDGSERGIGLPDLLPFVVIARMIMPRRRTSSKARRILPFLCGTGGGFFALGTRLGSRGGMIQRKIEALRHAKESACEKKSNSNGTESKGLEDSITRTGFDANRSRKQGDRHPCHPTHRASERYLTQKKSPRTRNPTGRAGKLNPFAPRQSMIERSCRDERRFKSTRFRVTTENSGLGLGPTSYKWAVKYSYSRFDSVSLIHHQINYFYDNLMILIQKLMILVRIIERTLLIYCFYNQRKTSSKADAQTRSVSSKNILVFFIKITQFWLNLMVIKFL